MNTAHTVLRGRWTVYGKSRNWVIINGNYSDRNRMWKHMCLPMMARKSKWTGRAHKFRDRSLAICWIQQYEESVVGSCGWDGIGIHNF